MRLTERVHQHLASLLQPGDIAIDATAGNGHDTLFMAQCVGKHGHIFAFDIQQKALDRTAERLAQQSNIGTVSYLHTGHEHMQQHIPVACHGTIQAITFNLGYLPQSDKTITTTANTTLQALHQACNMLANQGIISILAYTAHHGGREEAEAIKAWGKTLNEHFQMDIYIPENRRRSPPEYILIRKTTAIPPIKCDI